MGVGKEWEGSKWKDVGIQKGRRKGGGLWIGITQFSLGYLTGMLSINSYHMLSNTFNLKVDDDDDNSCGEYGDGLIISMINLLMLMLMMMIVMILMTVKMTVKMMMMMILSDDDDDDGGFGDCFWG